MGRIDLALRTQPGESAKLCVLKRMHAELRSREQDARFRREASIASQLSHGAIAQTFGIEAIDGELLLLQELVHGVDLRLLQTRLSSGGERVPLPIAIHVVSEVARALAYAHAFGDRGIVHRDVAPDNVMLAFSGEVKLVDFGIARSDVDATVTSTGQLVGRPTYTAPEVWAGARADRRADIYSLGVVLWQLLTGRRFAEVRASGKGRAPAPSSIKADVPAGLDAVVSRALAPDPNDRHQHAGELQDALRPFGPDELVPRTALAELLARHFDVARERRMLASDVERAMRLWPGAVSASEAAPKATKAPTSTQAIIAATRTRRPLILFGVGVAGLAVGVAAVAVLRPSAPAPGASVPMAAPAPAEAAVSGSPPAVPSRRAPAPQAHAMPTSAGRARPPGVKVARPAAAVPAEELLRRAQEKFDVGETQAALALARRAAGVGASASAHVLIGKVMMSERRFEEAEQEFAKAVDLDPRDGVASRLLALVRENRSGGP
jgi:serine/threonine-protein kinase